MTEEEEMAASEVNILSWVWGCLCFSSWNAQKENLQAFSSLLLICIPGAFVIISVFSISSYNNKDLPFTLLCVPEHFLRCLHPRCLLHFYGAWWILNLNQQFQLLTLFFLWKISMESQSYPHSHWDVVWCWDFRDVEKCSDDLASGCNRYLKQSFKVPLYVEPTLFCPQDIPGKKSAVDCHFLLQGVLSIPRLSRHVSSIGRQIFTTEPAGKPSDST